MRFVNNIKKFWKNQSNQSQQLIKDFPLLKDKNSNPLSIEYKVHLTAKEITSSQKIIDTIVSKIIENDSTKRNYAGKSNQQLEIYKKRVYKYESYCTQNVKLVPGKADRLDIYVTDIFLGKLPDQYTKNTLNYLQSTIVANFAYITGGPYKVFDSKTQSLIEKTETYDISLYIQFS
ncbi:hypothetical protein [Marinilactibacillus kalidii]|uniref:hypothetical protein n=1 Tax=Marinilactibacillus kalidii TaxID=2820274 RepID=UPI001ABE91F3|nr:hypothetical protein [Marinilactibacillus kalidii]